MNVPSRKMEPYYKIDKSTIYCGDCLQVMPYIEDKSVDMILCDLPYQQTSCKWDTIIPFEPLWKEYKRIIKDNSAIVLTASQPFTSMLVMSNLKMFKYEWIWEKAAGSNFVLVKYQPIKEHENVLVFSQGVHKYYPTKEKRKGNGGARVQSTYKSNGTNSEVININKNRKGKTYDTLRFPSSVQYFNNREKTRGLHPTQKPVELFKYLIKTYTNEGDLVLDNCMGSGTTLVAANQLNRQAIGIDNVQKYCDIAIKRLNEPQQFSLELK